MNRHSAIYRSYDHALISTLTPIRVIRTTHTVITDIVMHSHEFMELVIVTSGSARQTISIPEDQEYTHDVRRGDVYLLAQGEQHCYYMDPDITFQIINIIFDPSIFTALLFPEELAGSPVSVLTALYSASLRKKIGWALSLPDAPLGEVIHYAGLIERETADRTPGYRLRSTLLLGVLLSLIGQYMYKTAGASGETKSAPNINRAIAYIDQHYCQNVDLSVLAQLAQCSTRHLTRRFREIMGCTILQYIARLRMERACYLLLNTQESVTAVALAVGIGEMNHFDCMFKRHTGVTPTAYRKLNR